MSFLHLETDDEFFARLQKRHGPIPRERGEHLDDYAWLRFQEQRRIVVVEEGGEP